MEGNRRGRDEGRKNKGRVRVRREEGNQGKKTED